MSIYKRGKKWGVDVVYPDGRRIKKIIGPKKTAQKVETKLKNEIIDGKWQLRFLTKIKLKDFLETFLEHAENDLAVSTFKTNRVRIKKHLIPYFGRFDLIAITRKKVDDYKLKRIKDGAKANTIRIELSNLSKMFKKAIEWDYAHTNPVNGVEKPKVPKQPPRFLTKDEEKRLLEKSPDHLKPIIITGLNTGMRRSELFNLKWIDVDLKKREIVVRSETKAEGEFHTKDYDYRHIGINKTLYKVLSKLPRINEYVFTYKGKRIKGIRRSINTAYKNASIDPKGQPFHIFRHTFATRLLTAKNPTTLEKLQQLLGHEDFTTTLQYAHLTSRSFKDEVNRLD